MRKKFLRAGAVVMAAVMALAMPITAMGASGSRVSTFYDNFPRVDSNGAAEEGYVYKLSVYHTEDGSGPENVGTPAIIGVVFSEDKNGELYGSLSEIMNMVVDCPAGYEVKSVGVQHAVYGDMEDTDWEFLFHAQPYSFGVQNSQDWVEADPAGLYREGGIDVLAMWRFAVNYNGTLYQDCKAYVVHPGAMAQKFYYVVVPQGFDGVIELTLYGSKYVNGEKAIDESSYLTYNMNGGAAAQPAAPTEQQPVVTEQPAVAEQQPVVTQEQQPTVTTVGQSYYTTKPGDNLMKIAQETYGDKEKWKDIYELNKGMIKNPNLIWSNMQLLMP